MKSNVYKLALVFSILFIVNLTGVFAQHTEFYGMTSEGGEYNAGTIFNTNGNGDSLTAVYSFRGYIEGANPGGRLCKSSNGKFYGTNSAVLYEWDPLTNIYVPKFKFNSETGNGPGALTNINEKLYGSTSSRALHNQGAYFEYSPATNAFTKIIDIGGDTIATYSAILKIDNEDLYIITSSGVENIYEKIYKWIPATHTFIKKFDLDGSEIGGVTGSLVPAGNGKFYGTKSTGGAFDNGIIFEWDTVQNTITKKFDFDTAQTGGFPLGPMMLADNNKFYGVTQYGGTNGFGVLYEWDPITGIYAVKYNFTENNRETFYGLMQASNGKFYGLFTYGGAGEGLLFEWDPGTDTFSKKVIFDRETQKRPYCVLAEGDSGRLYGTTVYGSYMNSRQEWGTIFEWNPAKDTYTNKIYFGRAENGIYPQYNLVSDENGKLYGTTRRGGTSNYGVLFEWDPAKCTFTLKHNFDGTSGGRGPSSSLLKAENGKYYGISCFYDEDFYNWTLYEWDPIANLCISKKQDYNFLSWTGIGSLIKSDSGKIYGINNFGEIPSEGAFFEWDLATEKYTVKHIFKKECETLIQAKNGKMYGETNGWGTNGMGTLFEWDPDADEPITKVDFDGTEKGSVPNGYILQAGNDKIYGMTREGGLNDKGVLFEFDPATDTYTKLLDFNGAENGSDPEGPLMQAGNGKLYGMTSHGGLHDLGVLFEWDPLTNTYTKKLDFNGKSNGALPLGGLIEIETTQPVHEYSFDTAACGSYLSPGGRYAWSTSGIYVDTIPCASGCDSILTINLTIRKANASVTQAQGILTANAEDAAYQWIDSGNNNSTVEGETLQTFTASKEGTYAVIVSENGCIDTSDYFTVIPTGLIENTFTHSLTLYPNPNDGSFSIDLGNVYENITVTITGLDGQIIQKENRYQSHVIDLKMSAYPGLYIITINSENEKAVFRIVKK